jgi:hypothetical protein
VTEKTHSHRAINGWEKLEKAFGSWPSFHDAEVLNVELSRQSPSMKLELFTFLTDKEFISNGMYRRTNECVVTFVFSEIESLELFDFNHQNVIAGLVIEHPGNFNVAVEGVFGMTARFSCRDIAVTEVAPYDGPRCDQSPEG